MLCIEWFEPGSRRCLLKGLMLRWIGSGGIFKMQRCFEERFFHVKSQQIPLSGGSWPKEL